MIALVGLGGCDKLFSLSRLDPPIDAPACPATYTSVERAKSKYRYVAQQRLWDEAAADCRNDDATNTHLVVFDDAAEIAAMRTLVADAQIYTLHVGYARDTDGDPRVFYAVTGETLDLMSPTWDLWQQGEPNNFNGIETIVFIEHDKSLMDGEPSRSQRYICECDGRPATRTFVIR